MTILLWAADFKRLFGESCTHRDKHCVSYENITGDGVRYVANERVI